MTYIGYENLETGKYVLYDTNTDMKSFFNFVKSEAQQFNSSVMINEMIPLIEHENNRFNKDMIIGLLGVIVKSYIESGRDFQGENFFWLRTNGDRYHTLGRKLWKGANREQVQKFFEKNLKKDYDHVYQNW